MGIVGISPDIGLKNRPYIYGRYLHFRIPIENKKLWVKLGYAIPKKGLNKC
jgi:hypothetical protein